VLRALSLCTCCRHYPGAAAERRRRSSHPAVSAFPDNVVGSACTSSFSGLAQRSLALRPAHSRRHLYVTSHTEGFSHFVTSMTAPVASGWSGCRVGLAPTGKRRLLTAHTFSRHTGPRPRMPQLGGSRTFPVRVRKARCSARSRSSNMALEAKQNFACNVPATTAQPDRSGTRSGTSPPLRWLFRPSLPSRGCVLRASSQRGQNPSCLAGSACLSPVSRALALRTPRHGRERRRRPPGEAAPSGWHCYACEPMPPNPPPTKEERAKWRAMNRLAAAGAGPWPPQRFNTDLLNVARAPLAVLQEKLSQ
jgi:hypothetical protein